MLRLSVLLVLAACAGTPEDDSNPLAGDRRLDGVVTFDGHDDLDGYAFTSTTPASNRYTSAGADGRWLMQISWVDDATDPSVSGTFTLASPDGPVEPGTYPVVFNADPLENEATLILSVASNADSYSATGVGATGTFTLDSIDGGRAAGSFDMTGDASWTAGTGAPVYDLEGDFEEIPITEI